VPSAAAAIIAPPPMAHVHTHQHQHYHSASMNGHAPAQIPRQSTSRSNTQGQRRLSWESR
jgi:hypothetical protein